MDQSSESEQISLDERICKWSIIASYTTWILILLLQNPPDGGWGAIGAIVFFLWAIINLVAFCALVFVFISPKKQFRNGILFFLPVGLLSTYALFLVSRGTPNVINAPIADVVLVLLVFALPMIVGAIRKYLNRNK